MMAPIAHISGNDEKDLKYGQIYYWFIEAVSSLNKEQTHQLQSHKQVTEEELQEPYTCKKLLMRTRIDKVMGDKVDSTI